MKVRCNLRRTSKEEEHVFMAHSYHTFHLFVCWPQYVNPRNHPVLGWLIVWIFICAWKKGAIVWRWEPTEIYLSSILYCSLCQAFRSWAETFTPQMSRSQILCGVPFVSSIKLFMQGSVFAAYYNVVGNIVWFMPLVFPRFALWKKKDTLVHSGTGSGPLCHRVLSIYLLHRSQPYRQHSL